MSSFKNKHILITGGASGIGLLMGKLALNEGAARLIIWDADRTKLGQATEELQDYESQILTYCVDVSDPDQIYEAAQRVFKAVYSVGILINNAGIVTGKPFNQHSRKEINQTLKINLLGAMHTTRAFLPDMIRRSSGHIVNIASASGLMGNPKMSVYSGSKWGMIGWAESLRLEIEQDFGREPSYIKTGLFEGVTSPLLTPLLDPDDIARRIIEAIKKDKLHLRAPFMIKLLPFLRGILPTRVFDVISEKLFGVYKSMNTFKGRTNAKK